MKDEKPVLLGGIEGGGTKFVCAVGTQEGEVLAEVRFPTTVPGETLARAVDFFAGQARSHGPLAAIGAACFGPLDPRPGSQAFGRLLPTPKPGWSQADILSPLQAAFGVPVGFDTDVNGAALGEWRWGAARGLDTFLYLTVGTGIGGGGLANGELMHGLLHPEMGHILLPHDRERDPFEGVCPYHGDCLEGLASGPALQARWSARAETLPPDHPAWDLEAEYLALALCNFICTLSPQRIVLGGGVMEQAHLFPLVREKTLATLNGYIQAPQVLQRMDAYIVSPELKGRAGILGAFVLAERALETASTV